MHKLSFNGHAPYLYHVVAFFGSNPRSPGGASRTYLTTSSEGAANGSRDYLNRPNGDRRAVVIRERVR